MNRLKNLLAATACVLAATVTVAAQDTNELRTQLGQVGARTGVVIVKGSSQTGSIALGPGELSVQCRETTDLGTGEKVYGLAVEFEGNQFLRERVLVDDDEVDGLLDAVDYLSKISYDVTPLPSFEASYTTKAGLRVIADSVRKEGGVLTYVQFYDHPRVAITAVQMSQLYGLIQQSRKNLDALKSRK